MLKDYTHVSFVLDNSSSMNHLRSDTIGGFNSFLAKQKEHPGKMTFSLYQFDKNAGFGQVYIYNPGSGQLNAGIIGNGDKVPESSTSVLKPSSVWTTYEFVDLKDIPDLSKENYLCNTNTPLLDAIGYGIAKTGKLLADLPEDQRPENVIFVILTDGEENASRAYSHAQVTQSIKQQQEVYNWVFLFLGANQDAIQSGASYGIGAAHSMSFAATAASTTSTYNAVGDTVNVMRSRSAGQAKNVEIDDAIRSSVLDGTYDGK